MKAIECVREKSVTVCRREMLFWYFRSCKYNLVEMREWDGCFRLSLGEVGVYFDFAWVGEIDDDYLRG